MMNQLFVALMVSFISASSQSFQSAFGADLSGRVAGIESRMDAVERSLQRIESKLNTAKIAIPPPAPPPSAPPASPEANKSQVTAPSSCQAPRAPAPACSQPTYSHAYAVGNSYVSRQQRASPVYLTPTYTSPGVMERSYVSPFWGLFGVYRRSSPNGSLKRRNGFCYYGK